MWTRLAYALSLYVYGAAKLGSKTVRVSSPAALAAFRDKVNAAVVSKTLNLIKKAATALGAGVSCNWVYDKLTLPLPAPSSQVALPEIDTGAISEEVAATVIAALKSQGVSADGAAAVVALRAPAETTDRKLLLGIAIGAGLVLGGALAYYVLTGKKDSDDKKSS